jgi:hypothetical protein
MTRLAALAVSWLLLASAAGAEARIAGLEVAVEGNRALVSLALADAFDDRFVERLDSGLPTGIVYRFELLRDRKRWWDQKLAGTTLEVVALYDAVRREYTVNYRLGGELVESRTVRDRADLAAAMIRVGRAPVFTLEGYPRSDRLLIRARAELGAGNLLSFIPTEVRTDWSESRKFRPAGPR